MISLNIGGHFHSGWSQYVVYQGLGSIGYPVSGNDDDEHASGSVEKVE